VKFAVLFLKHLFTLECIHRVPWSTCFWLSYGSLLFFLNFLPLSCHFLLCFFFSSHWPYSSLYLNFASYLIAFLMPFYFLYVPFLFFPFSCHIVYLLWNMIKDNRKIDQMIEFCV
jgi:hypothetical protein